MIRFFVPGIPVAQPRQRHSVFTGKDGKIRSRNYTPAKSPVNVFKAAIQMAWPRGVNKLEGAVAIEMTFVFPRPKSKTRKVNVLEPKPSKPDWDNIGKAVCDALNGIAWNDDAQVTTAVVKKRMAGDGDVIGMSAVICSDCVESPPQLTPKRIRALGASCKTQPADS